MMNLSLVIKGWRRANGLSTTEAAKLMGVSGTVLNRVENGTTQGDNRGGEPKGQGSGMDGGTLARLIVWLLKDVKVDRSAKEAKE